MIVNQDQAVRSRCLFYLRVDNVVKSQITFYGIQEANGFELLKLLREFSLLSRSEATTVGRRAIYCKGPPECKHCGKTGHLAKDCRQKDPSKKPAAVAAKRKNQDQAVRSRCLFYLRVDNVVKSQITFYGIQEANGFELLKLLREFSLLSRSEATTVGRRAIYCRREIQ